MKLQVCKIFFRKIGPLPKNEITKLNEGIMKDFQICLKFLFGLRPSALSDVGVVEELGE